MRQDAASRLALGTAQFGLRYGVANAFGQVRHMEAAAILAGARASGADMLDTAIAYGESEATLGAVGVAGWKIVTKLPALPSGCLDPVNWVRDEVRGSLDRLGVGSVQAVLLHRPFQLLDEQGAALHEGLDALKREGLAKQTGISIYAPTELDALAGFPVDVVQLPFNILDARWRRSGWLERLHAQGVEVHARSVFLQGLLLMPPDRRPAWFSRWKPLWAVWDDWLAGEGLSPLQACLRYAMAEPGIARIVVGVDCLAHWREIAAAAAGPAPVAPAAIATEDPDLLNPASWKLN